MLRARPQFQQVMLESRDSVLLRSATIVASEHLSDPSFGVARLAAELGMSRRQLQRRLAEITGESPSALIRRMRLDRARRLVKARADTISGIAQRCGYRSRSHFAAAFRQMYGVLPSRYMRIGTARDETPRAPS